MNCTICRHKIGLFGSIGQSFVPQNPTAVCQCRIKSKPSSVKLLSSPNRVSQSRPSQELDLCALEPTFWWVLSFAVRARVRSVVTSYSAFSFPIVPFPWRRTRRVPPQAVLGKSHTDLQRCRHAAQSLQILRSFQLWVWLQGSSGGHLCKTEWQVSHNLIHYWKIFRKKIWHLMSSIIVSFS